MLSSICQIPINFLLSFRLTFFAGTLLIDPWPLCCPPRRDTTEGSRKLPRGVLPEIGYDRFWSGQSKNKSCKMASETNCCDQESCLSNYTLHDMFRIVGDQMTDRDLRVLNFLFTDILGEEQRFRIETGLDFFLALEKLNRCDETNFKQILHLLRIITRHDLNHYVQQRRRKTVHPDPVDKYLEDTSPRTYTITGTGKSKLCSPGKQATLPSSICSYEPQETADMGPSGKRKARGTGGGAQKKVCMMRGGRKVEYEEVEEPKEREKYTCDIRLRVRAEFCQHDTALQGNIFSNKPSELERQFERFSQANTILKSRDLGAIICDIKFSELTYLDAFWRDYINGSLLEALKGVFITDSLKQAVGHEAIKLLVNVDEDDYEAGRVKLLMNLTQ
ncbi:death effector domain-containing protein-like [Branchiostoma lanceolatum]|uniref:death effector domain-containing protein-like n=1 Tax=Branchiostoma lanceolatum TaxID=7740 RepID=UPI003456DDD0